MLKGVLLAAGGAASAREFVGVSAERFLCALRPSGTPVWSIRRETISATVWLGRQSSVTPLRYHLAMKSVVALDAEKSHLEAIRALSPAQRLQAFRRLCEQVESLRRAGAAARAARSEPRSP